jgi:hypothetical protein
MKQQVQEKTILIDVAIVSIIFIPTVAVSQLEIYQPIGNPKILALNYSEEYIILKVKNTGETANFYAYIESSTCKQIEPTDIFSIEANSIVEKKISVSCPYGSNTVKVIVVAMGTTNRAEAFITFTKEGKCDKPDAFCTRGQRTCLGNKILECDEYCTSWKEVKSCSPDEYCDYINQIPTCISIKERNEFYNRLRGYSIIVVLITISVAGIVGYTIGMRRRK